MPSIIKGFSKLSRNEKILKLREMYNLPGDFAEKLANYRHSDQQELFDDFSENTLSNYYLPFGAAPNFFINGRMYVLPMVIEESSVVAAASRAASFWAHNGGFKTIVHGTLKKGHIWFKWNGPNDVLNVFPEDLNTILREAVSPITEKMEKRGGGIHEMTIIPLQNQPGIYQLQVTFETKESMGANFINSCLEEMKNPMMSFFQTSPELKKHGNMEIIMSILSNYTTDCLVTSRVECPVEALAPFCSDLTPAAFAQKFKTATDIALADPSRAVTHNKGIFNGTDAVVIATGNDFRAAEAAGHAWAAQDGQYRSLSRCKITPEGVFSFEVTLPLALGTVGGLTRLHPLANLALEMLNNPSAEELMGIAASAGLANNFSAVSSLITTGIQKGHMKLHLNNLLKSMNATQSEKEKAILHFSNKTVSARAVENFLDSQRTSKNEGAY